VIFRGNQMAVLYYLTCYRRGEPQDVSAFAKETFFLQNISDWIIEHLCSAEGRFIKLLPVILTHYSGRVTQICVFNTVKLGTSATSP